MKRNFMIVVAVTALSGCAGLVAEYIMGRAGGCLCFQQVFEAVDDGALLKDLLVADLEFDAPDGVTLRVSVVGPASRGFTGLTLATADDHPLPDDDSSRQWVRMTVSGMGQVTHRYLEFSSLPADPSVTPLGTVLLLHSLNADRMQLLPWALELADHGWRSVLVDLRGHGQSGGTRGWGAADGQDIAAVVDALDAQGLIDGPVFAVGASYGAAAALHWAAADPRAHGAAAVAGFAVPAEAIAHGAGVAKPALSRVVGRRGLERGIAQAGKEIGTDLTDGAPLIAAAARLGDRLLLVHGADDRIVPLAHAERLHAAAPGSRFVVREGVGHVDLVVRQELFMDELLAWLATLRSRSG